MRGGVRSVPKRSQKKSPGGWRITKLKCVVHCATTGITLLDLFASPANIMASEKVLRSVAPVQRPTGALKEADLSLEVQ